MLTRDPGDVTVDRILTALMAHPDADTHSLFESILRDDDQSDDNRLVALDGFMGDRLDAFPDQLLELIQTLKSGAVLSGVLNKVAELSPTEQAARVLLSRLDTDNADTRAGVLNALQTHCFKQVCPDINALLADDDIRVRRSAAAIAGNLHVIDATESLRIAARDADHQLRNHGLAALHALNDPESVPLALNALSVPECQVAALNLLAQLGDVQHSDAVVAVTRTSRSADVLNAAVHALATWQEQQRPESSQWKRLGNDVAEIQGASGLLMHWQVAGTRDVTSDIVTATTGVQASENEEIEFLLDGRVTQTVRVNDDEVYSRESDSKSDQSPLRFSGTLVRGMNLVAVELSAVDGVSDVGLKFRRRSSKADHESLISKALAKPGNPERGRLVFDQSDKSLCVKCHRIENRGGQIGPDLSGIGDRFSRIHLIESILDPSHTVAPSYESVAIVLLSGLVVNGVRVAETSDTITLGDTDGKTHKVERSEIEEIIPQSRSTMPDGLERRLSEQEFIDLIGYLSFQKRNESAARSEQRNR